MHFIWKVGFRKSVILSFNGIKILAVCSSVVLSQNTRGENRIVYNLPIDPPAR